MGSSVADQAQEQLKGANEGEATARRRKALVSGVCAALAVPAAITIGLEAMQPTITWPWLLAAAAALACGALLCAALAASAHVGRARWLRGALGVLMLSGALLWASGALGQKPYETGRAALERGDYRGAAAAFGRAADAWTAPGVALGSAGAKVGVSGILLYPEWDALLWQGVALYGAGDSQGARDALDRAYELARASNVSTSDLEVLEEVRARVGKAPG